jgi:adenylate kinase family enzyme
LNRIAIIGNGGSGKTTLAHKLSKIYSLPVLHLDCIAYQASWKPVSFKEFNQSHQDWISGERWIIEGMKTDTLPARLQRADMVIFLDLPVWQSVISAFRRLVRDYGKTRNDMPPDCPESFDLDFALYMLTFRWKRRKEIMHCLKKAGNRTDIKIFKSRKAVNLWLDKLKAESEKRTP